MGAHARAVILSGDAHARHHQQPYVANYCIATGWCNRWLSAIGFFPACERLVTHLFGLVPRADEHAFQRSVRS
jgi:plasmanylethanolamine desaturase